MEENAILNECEDIKCYKCNSTSLKYIKSNIYLIENKKIEESICRIEAKCAECGEILVNYLLELL